MGIPKFFRWVSERYPLINVKIEGTVAPHIDNLYLDMNGIIHNCSSPSDDVTARVPERDMVVSIFTYIDKLFHAIKPRKLFFMAVDGPAPRAKMNQQRGRRFRSAKDAKEALEKALKEGKDIPKEPAFDKNSITPGTDFMDRLSRHLKWFIRKKIAEDSAWRQVNVIFSGQEVPGEGEHKIMQYIRDAKSKPDYDPNLSHCIYGLDADLMMLGLVTHEPNFCLLREEVLNKESKHSRRDIFQKSQFHFLSLTLLREYLDEEFRACTKDLPFKYDLERIVDDFVLICFLIGNDFLPNIPTVDISEGGLDMLLKCYGQVLPSLPGYLTEGGSLVLERVEAFLAKFAEYEFEPAFMLQQAVEGAVVGFLDNDDEESSDEDYEDVDGVVVPKEAPLADVDPKWRLLFADFDEDRSRRSMISPEGLDNDQRREWHVLAEEFKMVSRSEGEGEKRVVIVEKKLQEDAKAKKAAEQVQRDWRAEYYMRRFEGRDNKDVQLMDDLIFNYVQGLAWVYHYYHHGCVSWGWFYPYHYAPLLSDLRNLGRFRDRFDRFELGEPFLQYQQLLAVLPPASRNALPLAYRHLMVSPDSPIIDFYPQEFGLDMNGKRNDWEAVVVIPFIDEKRLLDAVKTVDVTRLSEEEVARNKLGKTYLFRYDPTNLDNHPSTLAGFRDIHEGHSVCVEYPLPTNVMSNVFVLKPSTRTGVDALGLIPTFKTLEHSFALRKIHINVFGGRPSDKATMVATLRGIAGTPFAQKDTESETAYLQRCADDFLGKPCIVRWPHWLEGRVVAITTKFGRADVPRAGVARPPRRWNTKETQDWAKDALSIAKTLLVTKGLDCGRIDVLVHASVLEGMRMLESGATKKYYSSYEVVLPIQSVLFGHNRVPDARYVELSPRSIQQTYPVGMPIVCSNLLDFGKVGKIVGHDGDRVVVELEERPPVPNFGREVFNKSKIRYYTLYEAAKRLNIPSEVLNRILGSVWVGEKEHKFNLGMKMKMNKTQKQIMGYTYAKIETSAYAPSRLIWELSEAALSVIDSYRTLFPEVFDCIAKTKVRGPGQNLRFSELFPGKTPEEALARAKECSAFLKSQRYAQLPSVPFGSEALSDKGIKMLEVECSDWGKKLRAGAPYKVKKVTLDTRDVRRPIVDVNNMDPNTPTEGSFLLCDRVMNLQDNGPIPYGLEGSIIGSTETSVTVLFDEEFLSGTPFGDIVSGRRIATGILAAGLFNMSRMTKPAFERNDWASFSVPSKKNVRLNESVDGGSTQSPTKSFSKPQKGPSLTKSTPGTVESSKPKRDRAPVPNEPPFRAFVGNLPLDTTDEQVKEVLQGMVVEEVTLKRGYAFIRFADKASLEKLLKLDGQLFRGSRVNIDVHVNKKREEKKPVEKPKRENLPVPENPPFSCFIGGLKHGTTEAELRELFAGSNIIFVNVKPTYGFVDFADAPSLVKALEKNGTEFKGKNIDVNVSTGKPDSNKNKKSVPNFAKPINKGSSGNVKILTKSGSNNSNNDVTKTTSNNNNNNNNNVNITKATEESPEDFDPAKYFEKLSAPNSLVGDSKDTSNPQEKSSETKDQLKSSTSGKPLNASGDKLNKSRDKQPRQNRQDKKLTSSQGGGGGGGGRNSSGGVQIMKRAPEQAEDPAILAAKPLAKSTENAGSAAPIDDPAILSAKIIPVPSAIPYIISSPIPSPIPSPLEQLETRKQMFEEKRKGSPCKFFQESGYCRKGAQCPFSHVKE